MNSLFILLLLLFLIYIIDKNRRLMKRVRKVKKYSVCANAIFTRDENALMAINNYMETEDSVEFLNKARILKAFVELERGLDPKETLSLFDLQEIILKDGKNLDKKKVNFNSDTFVWMLVLMIESKAQDAQEYVELVFNSINKYSELFTRDLAFNIMRAIHNIYNDIDVEGNVEFLKNIQNGNYADYIYDKNVIGIYKYLAVVVQQQLGLELDENDIVDLTSFSKMKIGHVVMADLGIYDTYAEKIEEPVEEPAEIAQEATEANEETAEKAEVEVVEASSEVAKESEPEVEETESEERE